MVLSQVNLPSAVVPPDGHPRRRSTCATISSEPRSAQVTLVQITTWWSPAGLSKYIE